MFPTEITVLIATKNRARTLRDVLRDLSRQEVGGQFRFDVLVVDNGSSDETPEAVREIAADYPVPLRYVCEPAPGKARALNRGLALIASPFVAMTDDDVSLPISWLWTLWQTLQEHDADGVGGRVVPRWIGARPAWLDDRLLRQLGMADHGAAVRVVDSPAATLIGPNCAYRRSLYDRFGGYDPGNPAEDSEWFHRVFRAGAKLVYQPAACVEHAVDGDALSPAALARRFRAHGRGYGRRLQRADRSLCRIPFWVFSLYAQLHGQALGAWIRGDRATARWHWLRRHLYWGAMQECVAQWFQRTPLPQPPPRLTSESDRFAEESAQ